MAKKIEDYGTIKCDILVTKRGVRIGNFYYWRRTAKNEKTMTVLPKSAVKQLTRVINDTQFQ